MFKSIKLGGWRQFHSVDIAFHDRCTVISGANGAGKTTILGLLNSHYGWPNQFIATLKRRKTKSGEEEGYVEDTFDPGSEEDDGEIVFSALRGWRDDKDDSPEPIDEPSEDAPPTKGEQRSIGRIEYSSGVAGELTVTKAASVQYPVNIHPREAVAGVHVPSHRPLFGYVQITDIPTVPKSGAQLHREYTNLVRQLQHLRSNARIAQTPAEALKKSLISLATFGFGNRAVRANSSMAEILVGFEQVLNQVLPPSLQFRRILIQVPEVNFVTGTGTFPIEAVSGGITAIVDIAWQIYTYTRQHPSCVITLDEPENHLHPEMQRNLLPNLLNAFPKAQFIVATHNPFVVGSVPDSFVYALGYNRRKRVVSQRISKSAAAGSVDDILREVLGLQSTRPDWVERKIDELLASYRTRGFKEDVLEDLRRDLAQFGLDDYSAATIAKLSDATD